MRTWCSSLIFHLSALFFSLWFHSKNISTWNKGSPVYKYARWKKFQFSMFSTYDLRKLFFSQHPYQFLKRDTKWPILEPLTVAKNLKYSYWPGLGTTVPPTKARVKGSSQTLRATQTENEEEVISQKDIRQTKN